MNATEDLYINAAANGFDQLIDYQYKPFSSDPIRAWREVMGNVVMPLLANHHEHLIDDDLYQRCLVRLREDFNRIGISKITSDELKELEKGFQNVGERDR